MTLTRHTKRDTVRQDDSDQASQGEDPPSYQARFIGYTPEGGPIIQFLEHPGEIDPSRGDVLGQNAEGMVTVLFHKDVQIVGPQDEGGSDQEKPANPRQHLAPPTVDSRPRAPVVRIQSPVSR